MVWKIGPECMAQHAKKVADSTRNWGERSACPTVMAFPPLAAIGPGPPPATCGARRTRSAAGISRAQASTPIASWAVRQSWCDSSQRAKGEIVIGATPMPAETSETARLRCFSNQPVTVTIMGAKTDPAAAPTRMP